jgi:hypothetical protein
MLAFQPINLLSANLLMLTNSTRVKPLQTLHLRDMATIILTHKVWLLDLSTNFFKIILEKIIFTEMFALVVNQPKTC